MPAQIIPLYPDRARIPVWELHWHAGGNALSVTTRNTEALLDLMISLAHRGIHAKAYADGALAGAVWEGGNGMHVDLDRR